ncbi:MAG: hypothetical protein ABSC34_10515, partial [Acidimicrobiales bacterium]
PASLLPTWLLDIGKVFPLEHVAGGLQTAFLVPGSNGLSVVNMVIPAIWALAALLMAVRTFRWESMAVGAG